MLRTWQLLSCHCVPRFDEFLIGSLCYPDCCETGGMKYAFDEILIATKVIAEIKRKVELVNALWREHVVDREEKHLDSNENITHEIIPPLSSSWL